jgi:hypothetical protein
MLVDLPEPIAAAIGKTFFHALIKLEPDGRLQLLVAMGEAALDATADAWLEAHVDCPDARRLGAELDVIGQGGGRA